MKCDVNISNERFSFDVEGDFFWGENRVLYNDLDNSVIAGTPWEAEGFTVSTILSEEEHLQMIKAMALVIMQIFDELKISYNPTSFRLEDYHHYVNNDLHQQIISKTRFLTFKDLSIDIQTLADRLSAIVGHKLSPKNPYLEKEVVTLRISRPCSLDINPPHRDGYLDYYKDTLNLWAPIAGCDENSSLGIIPGSHLWNEKEIFRTSNKSASIGKLNYHVPAIAQTTYGLNMVRPNPKKGEGLIFTPFLIHGCAVNLNQDSSRFSLEIRLFNQAELAKVKG